MRLLESGDVVRRISVGHILNLVHLSSLRGVVFDWRSAAIREQRVLTQQVVILKVLNILGIENWKNGGGFCPLPAALFAALACSASSKSETSSSHRWTLTFARDSRVRSSPSPVVGGFQQKVLFTPVVAASRMFRIGSTPWWACSGRG